MAWEYSGPGAQIFVGIPHRGQVSTAWAMNMLRALSPYLPHTELFTIQSHPIDVSRGVLVEKALEANAAYVYFLDSDVYTSPETLQRLLNHNVPIVTALYYRRHDHPINDEMLRVMPDKLRQLLKTKKDAGMPVFTPAIWRDFSFRDEKGNQLQSFRPIFDGEFTSGEMVEADAIPMGSCLIKTDVFRNLPRPWFYWTLGRDPSMLKGDISYGIQTGKGTRGCSEDLYFSLLARKHGYRLLCDTANVVRHESQVLVGSEGHFNVIET